MKVKELRMYLVTKDSVIYRSRRNGGVVPQNTREERRKLADMEVYQISANDKNELDVLVYC